MLDGSQCHLWRIKRKKRLPRKKIYRRGERRYDETFNTELWNFTFLKKNEGVEPTQNLKISTAAVSKKSHRMV